MKTRSQFLILIFSFLLLVLSACVRQPTSKESTVDNRPAISFKSQSGSLNSSYLVYVDKLPMGTAAQFRSGVSALRILSGSHLISVMQNGQTIYEQTLYVGDGAVKEIVIP